MFGFNRHEKAYLTPFLAFFALMVLGEFVAKPFEGYAFWMASSPRYWVNPLQTLVCGALLVRYWSFYELKFSVGLWFGVLIGAVVFGIWIAPQELFGATPRLDGFEPGFFGGDAAYFLNTAVRFLRLVVVVPLLEEIFWRGFLLRYLIHADFTKVPFGAFSWLSFSVVVAGFCLEHSMADWPGAILAGALYNLVAYRTRSLAACVIAHAVTNLLLGIYIMRTGQWGFW